MYFPKALKIFKWSGERNSGIVTDVKIYLDNVLFGEISEISKYAVATINDLQFENEEFGFMGLEKFIVDPKDKKKAYCEIVYGEWHKLLMSAPAFKYWFKGSEIWSFDGKKMLIEMIPDSYSRSCKSGTIYLYTDHHVELLMFCVMAAIKPRDFIE
jgi:hypothetical protein